MRQPTRRRSPLSSSLGGRQPGERALNRRGARFDGGARRLQHGDARPGARRMRRGLEAPVRRRRGAAAGPPERHGDAVRAAARLPDRGHEEHDARRGRGSDRRRRRRGAGHVSLAHARVPPRRRVLADVGDWRTGIASAALVGRPIGAPILFAQNNKLPAATSAALDALAADRVPSRRAARRSSAWARPRRCRATRPPTSTAANPAALAAALDRLQTAAVGGRGARGRGRLAGPLRSTPCPPPAGRPSRATRCCG